MRNYVLALLLVAGFIPLSRAASNGELLRCSFQSDLVGDAQFYLRYGRDSWSGPARVTCLGPAHTWSREMKVTFNGADSGTGVNDSSLLHLRMSILTTVGIEELTIFGAVSAIDRDGQIQWIIESGTMQVEATVTTNSLTPIPRSVRRGTLYVR